MQEPKPHIDIVECPRDAWQGVAEFIPTAEKIAHIKRLLEVGFHTIDAGSFVSPKAMPQMRDAEELFESIMEDAAVSGTKLLSIVASTKGAQRATAFQGIDAWGYPLSVSEEFQQRNTRKSVAEALEDLGRIKELAVKHNTKLVVYLSMAFGNPYGEDYHHGIVEERLHQAIACGADVVSISDTTGEGSLESIAALSSMMHKQCTVPWGAHLHSTYDEAASKALAAISNGCRRIDTAFKGFGGCPFAADSLIGNMPTEKVYSGLVSNGYATSLDALALESAYNSALHVFSSRS